MDSKQQAQARAELDSILHYAMSSAHHVFARLWQLNELVSAPGEAFGAGNRAAEASIIAEHLIARHKADYDRILERVHELAARMPRRAVG